MGVCARECPFRASLAAGKVGAERLVGRHRAEIDMLLADEGPAGTSDLARQDGARYASGSRRRAGSTSTSVIPRPATAPPGGLRRGAALGARQSLGPTKRCVYGISKRCPEAGRGSSAEADPGTPLRPSLHPRGDWFTALQISRGTCGLLAAPEALPKRRRRVQVAHQAGRFQSGGPMGGDELGRFTDSASGPCPAPARESRQTLDLPGALWASIVFDPRGPVPVRRRQRGTACGSSRSTARLPRRLPVYSEDTFPQAGAGRRADGGRHGARATVWARRRSGCTTWRRARPRCFRCRRKPRAPAPPTPPTRGPCSGWAFDEATLYASGWAGLRRWNLERESNELVAADVDFIAFLGPERRLALTGAPVPGRDPQTCRQLQTRDLVSGKTSAVGPPGVCVAASSAAVSGGIVAVPGPDGVLVGGLSGDADHLLVGHEGPVQAVAISPDGRWVATTGEDNTLRLWPMPDLAQPPLHTLPHDALVAKLKSLTNLRVVRDPESRPAGRSTSPRSPAGRTCRSGEGSVIPRSFGSPRCQSEELRLAGRRGIRRRRRGLRIPRDPSSRSPSG